MAELLERRAGQTVTCGGERTKSLRGIGRTAKCLGQVGVPRLGQGWLLLARVGRCDSIGGGERLGELANRQLVELGTALLPNDEHSQQARGGIDVVERRGVFQSGPAIYDDAVNLAED